LASKLNVELVNSTLKGITRFALIDLELVESEDRFLKLKLKDGNFIYDKKADSLTVNFVSLKVSKD